MKAANAIVREIEGAQESVYVQAYRLTAPRVVKALLAAHRRGVVVRIILDGKQQSAKYSDATIFHNAGVPVFIDSSHPRTTR